MVDKENKAKKSIHELMILGRKIAFESKNDELFEFFDGLEYLQALTMEKNDVSSVFEKSLIEFCQRFENSHIADKYTR